MSYDVIYLWSPFCFFVFMWQKQIMAAVCSYFHVFVGILYCVTCYHLLVLPTGILITGFFLSSGNRSSFHRHGGGFCPGEISQYRRRPSRFISVQFLDAFIQFFVIFFGVRSVMMVFSALLAEARVALHARPHPITLYLPRPSELPRPSTPSPRKLARDSYLYSPLLPIYLPSLWSEYISSSTLTAS